MNIVQHTGNINGNIIDIEIHQNDDNHSTIEDTISSGLAESQCEAPTECQVS